LLEDVKSYTKDLREILSREISISKERERGGYMTREPELEA
jgi:hypothetical protein